MKNLENYGVLEMNTKEIKETDGGIFGIDDAIILGAIALTLAVLNTDWDKAADDFKRGYNS